MTTAVIETDTLSVEALHVFGLFVEEKRKMILASQALTNKNKSDRDKKEETNGFPVIYVTSMDRAVSMLLDLRNVSPTENHTAIIDDLLTEIKPSTTYSVEDSRLLAVLHELETMYDE